MELLWNVDGIGLWYWKNNDNSIFSSSLVSTLIIVEIRTEYVLICSNEKPEANWKNQRKIDKFIKNLTKIKKMIMISPKKLKNNKVWVKQNLSFFFETQVNNKVIQPKKRQSQLKNTKTRQFDVENEKINAKFGTSINQKQVNLSEKTQKRWYFVEKHKRTIFFKIFEKK